MSEIKGRPTIAGTEARGNRCARRLPAVTRFLVSAMGLTGEPSIGVRAAQLCYRGQRQTNCVMTDLLVGSSAGVGHKSALIISMTLCHMPKIFRLT